MKAVYLNKVSGLEALAYGEIPQPQPGAAAAAEALLATVGCWAQNIRKCETVMTKPLVLYYSKTHDKNSMPTLPRLP